VVLFCSSLHPEWRVPPRQQLVTEYGTDGCGERRTGLQWGGKKHWPRM